MKVIYTPDIKDDLSTQMPSDEELELFSVNDGIYKRRG